MNGPYELDLDRPTLPGHCYGCGYSHTIAEDVYARQGRPCPAVSVQHWNTFAGARPLTLEAAVVEATAGLLEGLGLSWARQDRKQRAAVLRLVDKAMAV